MPSTGNGRGSFTQRPAGKPSPNMSKSREYVICTDGKSPRSLWKYDADQTCLARFCSSTLTLPLQPLQCLLARQEQRSQDHRVTVPTATCFQCGPPPAFAPARNILASLKVPTWKEQAWVAMLERFPVQLSPVCCWGVQHRAGGFLPADLELRLLSWGAEAPEGCPHSC